MSITTNSKISFPFHPFLFVLLPPLVVFNGNIGQLYPEELVPPTLLILIPTILLWVGFTFFFKNHVQNV